MAETDKILVVDDEDVIRELLTEVLSEEGYAVTTAASGPEAMRILEEADDFILLFTDIMMPEMTGLELIREARKLRSSIIPIVMTAYATIETARAAVKEGAYDYVLKPFSLSEVKLAVSNALERHRLTTENARLRELTQLFHISERIAAIRDEKPLLDFVLSAALERVGARRGSIMVMTEDEKTLEIKSSVGLPDDIASRPVEISKSISGMVAQTAQPLLVSHLSENPELAVRSRLRADDSFVSVPLEHKIGREHANSASGNHRVAAVLNVSEKSNGRPFSESDLKILSIVANQAAAALQNARLIRDIEAAHLSTIASMALLLEARDVYTQCHSQRVRDISVAIAMRQGLPKDEVETLRLGAAFHDIGKVGIPDIVLNKPDPLTPEEWQLMRRHPIIGYGVLEPIHFLRRGHLDVVRGHHERIDGSGYPDGLKGSDVSPLMRIMAVADSYDAMASDRAYRPALPLKRILEELNKARGTQFDPKVVDVFLDMLEKGEVYEPPS